MYLCTLVKFHPKRRWKRNHVNLQKHSSQCKISLHSVHAVIPEKSPIQKNKTLRILKFTDEFNPDKTTNYIIQWHFKWYDSKKCSVNLMTHSYVWTKTPLRDPPEEASGPGYIWWVCSSGSAGGRRLKCGWTTCKRSVPMERQLLRRVTCLQTTLHFHWAPQYLSGMCEWKQRWNSKWLVISPSYFIHTFVLFCM